jgi:bifunctional UDP-N-acetylglucosamine pyrophosphorylase/glucosamine-1-phosphate N-acetyltransferase
MMHTIAGLPLVHFGVQAALDAGCGEVIVVVGFGRQLVEVYLDGAFGPGRVRTAVQEEQRGSGDAARVGLAVASPRATRVLVINGDAPLIVADHLRAVLAPLDPPRVPTALALATCVVDDPAGYGRVVRRDDQVLVVREDPDLRDAEERAIREINAGIYAAEIGLFREGLATLAPSNAQGELYLTDVIAFANRAGRPIITVTLAADVLAGVNDRDQLARVEAMMHARIARMWRLAGVTVREGARIDANVVVEPEATIEAGAVLRGTTRVRRGAVVDVGCVLTDTDVGEGAELKPYSVAKDARIEPHAQVGPFAHLRPGSRIGREAHVGNFVETKNTTLGPGAKANHLAYLGDGIIGAGANVGAGTIFCNYDGFRKHTTTIEAGAFIGSDSQLVAPVTVGANAYVATGTTVTRDVPADALAIGRARQENKEGYASKLRARLAGIEAARSPKPGTKEE